MRSGVGVRIRNKSNCPSGHGRARKIDQIFSLAEKRVDEGKNRPSVSYTAPLLEDCPKSDPILFCWKSEARNGGQRGCITTCLVKRGHSVLYTANESFESAWEIFLRDSMEEDVVDCALFVKPPFGSMCKSCQKHEKRHAPSALRLPPKLPSSPPPKKHPTSPGGYVECNQYVQPPFGHLCRACQKKLSSHRPEAVPAGLAVSKPAGYKLQRRGSTESSEVGSRRASASEASPHAPNEEPPPTTTATTPLRTPSHTSNMPPDTSNMPPHTLTDPPPATVTPPRNSERHSPSSAAKRVPPVAASPASSLPHTPCAKFQAPAFGNLCLHCRLSQPQHSQHSGTLHSQHSNSTAALSLQPKVCTSFVEPVFGALCQVCHKPRKSHPAGHGQASELAMGKSHPEGHGQATGSPRDSEATESVTEEVAGLGRLHSPDSARPGSRASGFLHDSPRSPAKLARDRSWGSEAGTEQLGSHGEGGKQDKHRPAVPPPRRHDSDDDEEVVVAASAAVKPVVVGGGWYADSDEEGNELPPPPTLCDQCNEEMVAVECAACRLALCGKCDARMHARGAKQSHTRTAPGEARAMEAAAAIEQQQAGSKTDKLKQLQQPARRAITANEQPFAPPSQPTAASAEDEEEPPPPPPEEETQERVDETPSLPPPPPARTPSHGKRRPPIHSPPKDQGKSGLSAAGKRSPSSARRTPHKPPPRITPRQEQELQLLQQQQQQREEQAKAASIDDSTSSGSDVGPPPTEEPVPSSSHALPTARPPTGKETEESELDGAPPPPPPDSRSTSFLDASLPPPVASTSWAATCAECEQEQASLNCPDCEQLLCGECDERFHSKGRRKLHKRVPIAQSEQGGGAPPLPDQPPSHLPQPPASHPPPRPQTQERRRHSQPTASSRPPQRRSPHSTSPTANGTDLASSNSQTAHHTFERLIHASLQAPVELERLVKEAVASQSARSLAERLPPLQDAVAAEQQMWFDKFLKFTFKSVADEAAGGFALQAQNTQVTVFFMKLLEVKAMDQYEHLLQTCLLYKLVAEPALIPAVLRNYTWYNVLIRDLYSPDSGLNFSLLSTVSLIFGLLSSHQLEHEEKFGPWLSDVFLHLELQFDAYEQAGSQIVSVILIVILQQGIRKSAVWSEGVLKETRAFQNLSQFIDFVYCFVFGRTSLSVKQSGGKQDWKLHVDAESCNVLDTPLIEMLVKFLVDCVDVKKPALATSPGGLSAGGLISNMVAQSLLKQLQHDLDFFTDLHVFLLDAAQAVEASLNGEEKQQGWAKLRELRTHSLPKLLQKAKARNSHTLKFHKARLEECLNDFLSKLSVGMGMGSAGELDSPLTPTRKAETGASSSLSPFPTGGSRRWSLSSTPDARSPGQDSPRSSRTAKGFSSILENIKNSPSLHQLKSTFSHSQSSKIT
eukprot:g5380.t1